MTQRIVFEFLAHPDREPEKWARIKKIIRDAGGTMLSEPTGEPPYTLLAIVPEEAEAREVVTRLRTTNGVGRADVDEMRTVF